MKKFIKIATAILLLLLASFWGYISIKRAASYSTPIHKNASSLVRVDVYAIAQSLMSDFFKWRRDKQSMAPEGLQIPANIFVYTIRGKSPATFFCSLPVKDEQAFRNSIPANWILVHNDRYDLAQSPDKQRTIAFSKGRAAFSWSLKQEDVRELLSDIVLLKNVQPVSASPFRTIREQEGHITWSDGKNKAALTFEEGKARLVASGFFPQIRIPEPVRYVKASTGKALDLWLYADMEPFLKGTSWSHDSLSLSGDSLLAAHPGGIALSLQDPVLQRDTVVTYEYNDDFEKVATTTIKETKVPGILCYCLADPAVVYPYLQRQHILRDSGKISTALFPLYQLYMEAGKGAVIVSTLKRASIQPQQEESGDFFHLDIDFEQWKRQPDLAALLPYTHAYQTLEARARKEKNGSIRLEATLLFRNREKQSLLQLMEALQMK